MSAVGSFWEYLFPQAAKDPNVSRLEAALLDAERRLARVKAAGNNALQPVVNACETSLQNARKAAAGKSFFLAWDCIHQFNDDIVATLDPAELAAHWASISSEADAKLSGWRSKAAEVLKKSAAAQPPPLPVVRELQRHLAAASQNQQHKIEVYATKTLPSLGAFLLLVVAVTLVFCFQVINSPEPSKTLLPWAQAIFLGVVSGLLGGVLSMTFSLGRVDLTKKIPDMRLSGLVTSIRPLLGAAVAIPVVVFVEANYVEMKGFDKPLSIMAFSFLAGFSERWFLGLVEKFEGGKK